MPISPLYKRPESYIIRSSQGVTWFSIDILGVSVLRYPIGIEKSTFTANEFSDANSLLETWPAIPKQWICTTLPHDLLSYGKELLGIRAGPLDVIMITMAKHEYPPGRHMVELLNKKFSETRLRGIIEGYS